MGWGGREEIKREWGGDEKRGFKWREDGGGGMEIKVHRMIYSCSPAGVRTIVIPRSLCWFVGIIPLH